MIPQRSRFPASLWHEPALHLSVVALTAFLSYSNTFDASFHFDDVRNIVSNSIIRDFGNFIEPSRVADHPYYFDFKMRYVGFLTFALNHGLHGLNLAGFHAVNLLIHVVNGFLVYFLVLLTFRTPGMRSTVMGGERHDDAQTGPRRLIAFFAALFFVSHPIQTQAVTYVVQRFASLATSFYLAAVVSYAGSRLNAMHRRPVAACCLYGLALSSTVLAMKTKEISFTIPIIVALYEYLFFGKTSGSRAARLARLVPFILTFAVIPLGAVDFDGDASVLSQLGDRSRVLTGMSRHDYFLTQLTVIPVYIGLIFLPLDQNLDYDHPIHTVFLNSQVVYSTLLILFVLFVGAFLASRSHSGAGGWRLTAFGIFWFLVALLPESSIVPIVDVIYEHRVYLPSVGAFVAISSGVVLLAEKYRAGHPWAMRAVCLLLGVAVLLFSAMTHARNAVWKDEITLWEDVVSKSGNKDRARNTLGAVYLESGRLDRATAELLKTLEINPRYWAAHVNLGSCYMRRAESARREGGSSERVLELVDRAIASYRHALTIDPGNEMIDSLIESAYRTRHVLTTNAER